MNAAYYEMLMLLQQQTQALIRSNISSQKLIRKMNAENTGVSIKSAHLMTTD